MFMFVIMLILQYVGEMGSNENQSDPGTDYVVHFKEKTEGPVGVLTTSGGAPVCNMDATNTLNSRLINNEFFLDSITHITREIIPERVVHAKGAGAFGYFEVTHDISHICRADFLKKVGKKTPLAVRFATTSGKRGSSDLTRDVRGFSVKFYTKEGNFDIVGFNTPTYFYKDPLRFSNFVHATGRNPVTNLIDPNTFWDICTLVPESLHTILYMFADRGIPLSYRNMPGFGIHTYQVENKLGKQHFIKFHIIPDAGINYLGSEKARNISATDPDYLTRDLFRSVSNGDCPSWTVSVQILTESDLKEAGDAVFDVTKVISLDKYPLHPVGKIVLNKNAKNYHAQIEQLAFCPANLVPGIIGAPDKLFESRRLAYRDAQIYRLGGNFKKVTVNCPFQVETFTYNRGGVPPVGNNENDAPNYFPNSFHGPKPFIGQKCTNLIKIRESKVDNFEGIAELYSNEFTSDERTRLIDNLVFSIKSTNKFVQKNIVEIFTHIHADLGYRTAQGLNNTSCNSCG